MAQGIVYLIGAGPGDPKLITVRGRECIWAADVILYDRLANPALLEEARTDAELVFVGKEPGQHHVSQERTEELLVEYALAGKIVARLKGGDPLVFGRGGEEALVLKRHGIPFEIVPGVTSGIAAAAYAGIPVTQRGMAASFAVVTGHECPGKEQSSIRWESLATGVDTIAFYMGLKNLPLICEQLVQNGRDPQTPVALIQQGTTAEQVTVVGTLANIVARAQEHQIQNPAIILVGEVVGLREQLAWYAGEQVLLGL